MQGMIRFFIRMLALSCVVFTNKAEENTQKVESLSSSWSEFFTCVDSGSSSEQRAQSVVHKEVAQREQERKNARVKAEQEIVKELKTRLESSDEPKIQKPSRRTFKNFFKQVTRTEETSEKDVEITHKARQRAQRVLQEQVAVSAQAERVARKISAQRKKREVTADSPHKRSRKTFQIVPEEFFYPQTSHSVVKERQSKVIEQKRQQEEQQKCELEKAHMQAHSLAQCVQRKDVSSKSALEEVIKKEVAAYKAALEPQKVVCPKTCNYHEKELKKQEELKEQRAQAVAKKNAKKQAQRERAESARKELQKNKEAVRIKNAERKAALKKEKDLVAEAYKHIKERNTRTFKPRPVIQKQITQSSEKVISKDDRVQKLKQERSEARSKKIEIRENKQKRQAENAQKRVLTVQKYNAKKTRQALVNRVKILQRAKSDFHSMYQSQELQEHLLQEQFELLSFERDQLSSMVNALSYDSSAHQLSEAIESVFDYKERAQNFVDEIHRASLLNVANAQDHESAMHNVQQALEIPLRVIEYNLFLMCGMQAERSVGKTFRTTCSVNAAGESACDSLEWYLVKVGKQTVSALSAQRVLQRLAQEKTQVDALHKALHDEADHVGHQQKQGFVQGTANVLQHRKHQMQTLLAAHQRFLPSAKIQEFNALIQEFPTTV